MCDTYALIAVFGAAISVWIRRDTRNRPNINCDNCWKSFVYRPKFTRFPSGHATKSLRAIARCCLNSPKIEATTTHQSLKKMLTDPNCICKSEKTTTFSISSMRVFRINFFIFVFFYLPSVWTEWSKNVQIKRPWPSSTWHRRLSSIRQHGPKRVSPI